MFSLFDFLFGSRESCDTTDPDPPNSIIHGTDFPIEYEKDNLLKDILFELNKLTITELKSIKKRIDIVSYLNSHDF